MQNFPNLQTQSSQAKHFTAVDNQHTYCGTQLAHWRVENCERVKYERDSEHTLSLYLSGGYSTYRADQKSNKGAPGKFCLMPQGQNSLWHVKDQLELVHLYFSDTQLKRYVVTHLEIDARQVDLRDLVYQTDVGLEKLFKCYVKGLLTEPATNYLFWEQLLGNIFCHLITHYAGCDPKGPIFKNGLSLSHRKRVLDYIHENMQEKITIEVLAKQVNISPYHFAHLFKQSFAQSPANFVLNRRIEKAKTLLSSQQSINAIAALTGFNQQSHFTHYFKRQVGLTPARFRKQIMGV